jgi:hypothetical protein
VRRGRRKGGGRSTDGWGRGGRERKRLGLAGLREARGSWAEREKEARVERVVLAGPRQWAACRRRKGERKPARGGGKEQARLG